MEFKRLHLFEFEDKKWFPQQFRNYMTDFLREVTIKLGLVKPISSILDSTLKNSRQQSIIDLCSGAGGMLVECLDSINSSKDNKISATLSDKYPNIAAYEHIRKTHANISYVSESVDAVNVPKELNGLRTVFVAFHHFPPNIAELILRDAYRNKASIAIFEITQRSIQGICFALLGPIATLIITPVIRPFSLGRIFFTYIIPAVPFFILFDGIISAFRTYTTGEMEQMVDKIGDTNYQWEVNAVNANWGYKITYLIGYPTNISII